MATSPRNNPGGPYLRCPCLKEQDQASGSSMAVRVQSLVHRQRLVQNYQRRGWRRLLARS